MLEQTKTLMPEIVYSERRRLMKRICQKILFVILVSVTGGLLLHPQSAEATGVCSNCHVMHASQQGTASTPNDYLLNNNCLGCHSGTNATDATAPAVPYVYTAGVSDLTTSLAGGNFKFADDNDRYGHNPVELSGGVDTTLTSPPGWKIGFNANGQVGGTTPNWGSNNLSCAGIYGCHGKHDATGVTGSHHLNATGAITTPSTVATSYRFLFGIKGYEAADYEFSPLATTGAHNVYYGVARTGSESSADTPTDTATMSYFCAECHGIFHSGASSNEGIADVGDTFLTSPWIRHPVDISMPTTGEYSGYSAYRPDVPVASSDVSDGSLTVTNAADRIVMCLSCHRAHASPYPASLRWDPTTVVAGGGTSTVGCFACHTTKDDGV